MEKHTLFELHEHIRRVLALNLPAPVWVSCEIAQANEARGHCFLSLVQKDGASDQVIAQAEGVIWQSSLRKLRRKLGRTLDGLLQDGIEALLLVQVDFHERYGFKLVVEDIDPAYTLGQLELRRRQILERLENEQLIGRNRRHALPIALQRIAIISSETAAGLQDFLQQLQENAYGYRFDCQLFAAAMQGGQTEEEVIQQLRKIERRRAHFDCAAIIRGGGAKLDLAAFDNYELCKAIAESTLPVLTGIGHDVDEVLLDKVAHTALKTPTAVADFIVHRNMEFEGRLQQLGQQLRLLANHKTREAALWLERQEQAIQHFPRQLLNRQRETINRMAAELPRLARQRLRLEKNRLEQFEQLNQLLSPEATLKRGFSITLKEGKAVRSVQELKDGERITTRLEDGEVDSVVGDP
ncbi:MAG: exodeoxyribonuclease VII large subunit [Phaeodactylibacter sp.]|nr:exodeoxyribonuclease VII large subunit [Phaeodactylibacter sp.]MCB9049488.1 exodeoxyribonuclease VII large subunit [Lewinellaceae bacterium]